MATQLTHLPKMLGYDIGNILTYSPLYDARPNKNLDYFHKRERLTPLAVVSSFLEQSRALPFKYRTDEVEKVNKSDHLADYLDLTFIIDSGGKLSTRLYDKRDDFDFHIVNFPFLSSNIPSGPSDGVYISQLIRYAQCCSHYDDFRYRHKCLVDRLLSQGYKALRLEKSFKKFYGRYQDLIEKYQRSVNAMVSDSFPGQFLFNM